MAKLGGACWVMLAVVLVGCQPVGQNAPSKMPFVLQGNTVILDKSHILSTQTKLYQPSFDLSGVLLPQKHANITSPDTGTLAEVFVAPNSRVKQGEPLFSVWIDNPSFADNPTLALLPNQNPSKPIVVYAPFSGTVSSLHAKAGMAIQKDSLLLSLDDNRVFEFVSFLPKAYEAYLTVGQTVNFAIQSTQIAQDRLQELTQAQTQSFAGQVIDITPTQDQKLAVKVHIVANDDTPLQKGQQVAGHIDYGDLTQGVIVPDFAIADGTSFLHLKNPPHKPPTPLNAHIWVIRQDGKLKRTPVKIIEYDPNLQRYLVAGLSQDSLLTSANLPNHADGFLVKIR